MPAIGNNDHRGAVGVEAASISVGLGLSDFGTAIAIACAFFLASGLIAGLWALLPHVAPAGTAMWVLLWLVVRKFSSSGARDGVEPRISVVH